MKPPSERRLWVLRGDRPAMRCSRAPGGGELVGPGWVALGVSGFPGWLKARGEHPKDGEIRVVGACVWGRAGQAASSRWPYIINNK